MNKTDAMERLDAIEAKTKELEREAEELRRIIEAPEQTWKPEELVGKLCYVWDGNKNINRFAVVSGYDGLRNYPYMASTGACFVNAEPVPAAEVEKMIYRKSRYDWSKAPEWANLVATDRSATIFWFETKPIQNMVSFGVWDTREGRKEKHSMDGTDCPDWAESLERRP